MATGMVVSITELRLVKNYCSRISYKGYNIDMEVI